ncbi:hypothetical protein BKA93DRAFT_152367 [Sparassis latifolia]
MIVSKSFSIGGRLPRCIVLATRVFLALATIGVAFSSDYYLRMEAEVRKRLLSAPRFTCFLDWSTPMAPRCVPRRVVALQLFSSECPHPQHRLGVLTFRIIVFLSRDVSEVEPIFISGHRRHRYFMFLASGLWLGLCCASAESQVACTYA